MEIRIVWAPAESSWVSVCPEPLGCERGARALVRPGPAQSRGQMGLGLQEARVDSAKRFCTCLYGRTEWISAGPPGQRRSAPALSLVPLCLQSFFRQVLFTSSSELKDPLCSRRYRKQARLGGALMLPATCLRLNGLSVRDRAGRGGRRVVLRHEVECTHSSEQKKQKQVHGET